MALNTQQPPPPQPQRRKRLKVKKADPNTEDWLTTYADAVTLVLCFFILMFSVSEPKEAEFKKISEAFKAAGFIDEVADNPFSQLREELEIMVENNALEQVMSVEETDDGIELELSSSSFYHSGSAKFRREAIPILEQVADVLRDFDYDAYNIIVDGHTDDVPIRSEAYPSNWELSAGRATNIVRFFIADGLTKELMHAAGYADVDPKVPNLDDNGNPIPSNRELNRRVVVRIERID